MNPKWRRRVIGGSVLAALGCVLSAGIATSYSVAATHVPVSRMLRPLTVAGVPLLRYLPREPAQPVRMEPAAQVPVLAWHALDDRCAPGGAICKGPDYESVSLRQFTAELAWLHAAGYHAITLDAYLAWLARKGTLLPSRPVLLMDDNGDADFLLGAEPVLYRYRFALTAVIVTGFADAATTGYCLPKTVAYGHVWNVQANCGGPNTWNATWPQLAALSPAVYNYALEAGPAGHFVQSYSRTCPAYYACMMPGETARAYELRVARDMQAGLAELAAKLPGRVNTQAWTAPYSDLGYSCPNDQCPEEFSTGPRGWLAMFAQVNFQAVFMQTRIRNGVQHERFRYEIQAGTTQQQFRQAIGACLRAGAWRR